MATYQELSQKIAQLRNQAVRAEGAVEQAEAQYQASRQRIRDRGIDPDNIDSELRRLDLELERRASELRDRIQSVSEKLREI